MKKSKIRNILIASLSSACVMGAALTLNAKGFFSFTRADGVTHKVVMDVNNGVTASEISTKQFVRNTNEGNPITWKLSGISQSAESFIKFADCNAYMYNETPLRGINHIKLSFSANRNIGIVLSPINNLDYKNDGWNTPGVPPEGCFVWNNSSDKSKGTWDIDITSGYYEYIRIEELENGGNIYISNIEVTYSCIEQHVHDFVHHDREEAMHENDGHEEYYSCSKCSLVFDAEKNQTTMEDLVIKSKTWTYPGEPYDQTLYYGKMENKILKSTDTYIPLFDIRFDNPTVHQEFGFSLYQESWGSEHTPVYWFDSVYKSKAADFEGNPYGLKFVLLEDGYYRVYIKPSEVAVTGGTGSVDYFEYIYCKHPNDAKNRGNGTVEILPKTLARITYLDNDVTKGETRSQHLNLLSSLSVSDERLISLELTFMNNSSKARFMLHGTSDWANRYGYWALKNDGSYYEGSPDSGLTITVLEPNKLRIVIDFDTCKKEGTPDDYIIGVNFDWGDFYGHIKISSLDKR